MHSFIHALIDSFIGTAPSCFSPGRTSVKSVHSFSADPSRAGHLSGFLSETYYQLHLDLFPLGSCIKSWWLSQVQFGKLPNSSCAKNTELEKVFCESASKYLCVWAGSILRRAHRVGCESSPRKSTDGLPHKEVSCNYHSLSLHFSSWLNMGELNQTISMLSGRSLTAGVFHSVRDKVLACTTRASWLATVN